MASAIEIEGLEKRYIIEHNLQRGDISFREEIVNAFKRVGEKIFRPFARHRSNQPQNKEEFWALKNISLKISPGERVGIIGRNGAGKTTLLKILSRITEPTGGRVTIKGRVASLLEVGTGFHGDLTGRENIFLNGAILGMSRAEIKKKFDEIVDFAEVEKFLDTPVKRYSSGMYVRLAFAVAAHLEPEILLVDEVLAVGDLGFQKKCLGKMEGVSKSGRTILFVSHQMGHIATLCSRCLFLQQGKLILDGPTQSVISAYLDSLKDAQFASLRDRKDRQGTGQIRVVDTWIEDESGNRVQHVFSGSRIKFVVKFERMTTGKLSNVLFSLGINSSQGVWTTDFATNFINKNVTINSRDGQAECIIPKLSINYGSYTYNVMVRSGNSGFEIFDFVKDVYAFTVEPGDYYGSGYVTRGQNVLAMDHDWGINEE